MSSGHLKANMWPQSQALDQRTTDVNPWRGRPKDDFTRLKQATAATETVHKHRADARLRTFSWQEAGE